MSYLPTIQVRPLTTPEQVSALKAAAAHDNHQPLSPSHFVTKAGEVVGYLTLGWCVNWWLHSQKCDRHDSQYLVCALETLQAQHGIEKYVVLCAKESPYARVMEERFGTRKLGETVLFERHTGAP